MRFVECCIVTVAVTMLTGRQSVAQNAAPVPAGVVRRVEIVTRRRPAADSSQTPLRDHMIVGSAIGGLAGIAVGGMLLKAASGDECLTVTSTVPGLEGGCSENLTPPRAAKLFSWERRRRRSPRGANRLRIPRERRRRAGRTMQSVTIGLHLTFDAPTPGN
jgi:hypothetical protein